MASPDDPAVVVPAVYAPHAVTCFRSLRPRGIHTIGVYERPTPAFRSRYCAETVTVPGPEADVVGYKDGLRSLAERDAVRTVFPMREADVYVLSKYQSEFADAVTPCWPAFETLEIAHDRVQLVAAAEAAGVATPETTPLDAADDWMPRQIVKARYALLAEEYADRWEGGVTEPTADVRYLDAGERPDPETFRVDADQPLVVQEYIPGDEYSFWALYDDGDPVATCLKRQVRAFSYEGGTSIYRETVDIPELAAAGQRLLDHLDWDGFASVQFKRDARTGEFTLLEINPRVWVSVACPVLAGVDFPYYYWQLAVGDPVTAPVTHDTGVGTHRLGGEVMYLGSLLGEDDVFVEAPSLAEASRAVLASLYRQPNFDYLAVDDPVPFFDDVGRWLREHVAATLRDRLPTVGAIGPSEDTSS